MIKIFSICGISGAYFYELQQKVHFLERGKFFWIFTKSFQVEILMVNSTNPFCSGDFFKTQKLKMLFT